MRFLLFKIVIYSFSVCLVLGTLSQKTKETLNKYVIKCIQVHVMQRIEFIRDFQTSLRLARPAPWDFSCITDIENNPVFQREMFIINRLIALPHMLSEEEFEYFQSTFDSLIHERGYLLLTICDTVFIYNPTADEIYLGPSKYIESQIQEYAINFKSSPRRDKLYDSSVLTKSDKFIQTASSKSIDEMGTMSLHHIISQSTLPLLGEFFHFWVVNSQQYIINEESNDKPLEERLSRDRFNKLFARGQILIMISRMLSQANNPGPEARYSFQLRHDSNGKCSITTSYINRSFFWNRGNVFWGPTSRTHDERHKFAERAKTIIGEESFEKAKQLDLEIREWNDKVGPLIKSNDDWNRVDDSIKEEGMKLIEKFNFVTLAINNGTRGPVGILCDPKLWFKVVLKNSVKWDIRQEDLKSSYQETKNKQLFDRRRRPPKDDDEGGTSSLNLCTSFKNHLTVVKRSINSNKKETFYLKQFSTFLLKNCTSQRQLVCSYINNRTTTALLWEQFIETKLLENNAYVHSQLRTFCLLVEPSTVISTTTESWQDIQRQQDKALACHSALLLMTWVGVLIWSKWEPCPSFRYGLLGPQVNSVHVGTVLNQQLGVTRRKRRRRNSDRRNQVVEKETRFVLCTFCDFNVYGNLLNMSIDMYLLKSIVESFLLDQQSPWRPCYKYCQSTI